MPKTPRLLLATLFLGGAVSAQPPPTPEPAAPPATVTKPTAPGAEVDVSVKQRPNLTPQEMLTQGQDYFRSMNEIIKRMGGLQETAKRQKDIIKLNCVTDKLVQAKVNLNIAEQSMTSLQENIARADEGGRTHEFTRLTIVNQKVLVLGAEAENCIGEDLSFVGATRVDVEVDPSIPVTDPTQPGGPVVSIERPPVRPDEASPFR